LAHPWRELFFIRLVESYLYRVVNQMSLDAETRGRVTAPQAAPQRVRRDTLSAGSPILSLEALWHYPPSLYLTAIRYILGGPTAELVVTSRPNCATVRVDGDPLTRTDSLLLVAAGRHRVTVSVPAPLPRFPCSGAVSIREGGGGLFCCPWQQSCPPTPSYPCPWVGYFQTEAGIPKNAGLLYAPASDSPTLLPQNPTEPPLSLVRPEVFHLPDVP
jgi:hypothetical protein